MKSPKILHLLGDQNARNEKLNDSIDGNKILNQIVIPRLVRGIHAGEGMEKKFWVYMLASQKGGTLYIGMTSDIVKRVWEHKNNVVEGFTKTYNVHNLVWFEEHATAEQAIKREKRLKNYDRQWKINLIQERNRDWVCLYNEICM